MGSVEAAAWLIVTVPLSTSSSTPVTVMVCGALQRRLASDGEKVRLAGDTVAPAALLLDGVMVTSPPGRVWSTTV